jgi:hypothetical protein
VDEHEIHHSDVNTLTRSCMVIDTEGERVRPRELTLALIDTSAKRGRID